MLHLNDSAILEIMLYKVSNEVVCLRIKTAGLEVYC